MLLMDKLQMIKKIWLYSKGSEPYYIDTKKDS